MSAGAADDFDTDELDFGDDSESLPWLETDGEDDAAGFDTGRLLGIGLLMLAALGAIVGGIWYFTNSAAGSGPEPDGSLIEAPAEPYRTRPANAGGKEFPGTGDTSFAVGEGQTREGRLADTPPAEAARQEPTSEQGDSEQGASEQGTARRSSAPARGTGVQVGAYSTVAAAEKGWATLRRQTEALNGADYRIVEGRADIGSVQRLYVATGSASEARQLCNALRGDGLDCQVK